jgi:hypothetical protein
LPTEAAVSSASPTATSTSGSLHWEKVASVGRFPENESVDALVGFDGGYLAVRATVNGDRLWLSADGTAWQAVDGLTGVIQIARSYGTAAVTTNGRQILLFGASPSGGHATAWLTSDGREWHPWARDVMPDADWGALAAWPIAGGWQAALYEVYVAPQCDAPGCSRITLWQSTDASEWDRLSTLVEAAQTLRVAGAALDGTILVAADDQLLRSADRGLTWNALPVTDDCASGATAILAPSTSATSQWLVAGQLAEGSAQVCTASGDLGRWTAAVIPTGSSLKWQDLVATSYGFVYSAAPFCLESGDCPPKAELFLSHDGQSWLPLDGPVDDQGSAAELRIADGPAGVVGLASTFDRGTRNVSAWRLVGGR